MIAATSTTTLADRLNKLLCSVFRRLESAEVRDNLWERLPAAGRDYLLAGGVTLEETRAHAFPGVWCLAWNSSWESGIVDLAWELGLIEFPELRRLRTEISSAGDDRPVLDLFDALPNVGISVVDADASSTHKAPAGGDGRKWLPGELFGKRRHETTNGKGVSIVLRGGKYAARGRVERKPYFETLGATESEAQAALLAHLAALENDSYTPVGQRGRKRFKGGAPALSVKELANRFVDDARKRLGAATANNYASRVAPLVLFADRKEVTARYKLARDVDRDFIVDLRTWLLGQSVTRNGHPDSAARPRTSENVMQVMSTCRRMFTWARDDAELLPHDMRNPVAKGLIGRRHGKDPARPHPFPLDLRILMVQAMDLYEILHLTLSLILGVRPEDYCGCLISDVDLDAGEMHFGARFGGVDFNKTRLSFRLPIPPLLFPVFHMLRAGRAAGPLLRHRRVWEGTKCVPILSCDDDLRLRVDAARAAAGQEVMAEGDLKHIYRKVLREVGGLSVDQLRSVYSDARRRAGLSEAMKMYDLKSGVTTDLEESGLSEFAIEYLTGHSVSARAVMPRYKSFDPQKAIQPYFQKAAPLFEAILSRFTELSREESRAQQIDTAKET